MLVYKTHCLFDEDIAKKHYLANKDNLDDVVGFEGLISDDFWNIYNNGEYVGSIFVYLTKDDKRWLGGYAVRKQAKAVLQAVKEVANLYENVYTKTRHKQAKLVLLRAGFKEENNLMRWQK